MNAPIGTSLRLADAAPELDLLPFEQPEAAPGLDIKRLLGTLLRGSPIIAASVLVWLALGFVLINELPAKYTSSVSILIDPKRPDAVGADGVFANLSLDSGRVASVEQILVSSAVLGRVVAQEHLAADPAMIRPPGLLAQLSHIVFGKPLPPANDSPTERTAMAIERLAKSVKTERVGMTYVVKVNVSADEPHLAQRLAGEVADAYLADQLDTKYAAARRDAAWLKSQLQTLRQNVMDSEAKSEAIRQRYGLVQTDAAPGSSLDRQEVSSLNGQLAEARADVASTGARYEQVQRVEHGGGGLEGLPAVVASKVIGDLRAQQATAARRVADLARHFTDDYSELRAARHDLAAVDAEIAAEVSRVVSGLKNEYEIAVSRRDALQAQVNALVGATTAAPSAQGRVALREAERVSDANRLQYETALNRLRDVEQQVSREEVEARIISRPELPDGPSFPKPVMFMAGGGVMGLATGLGFVMLRPKLQSRLSDPDDARALLRLPVLTMSPILRRADLMQDGARISIPDYLLSNPISRYAESLRVLRMALQNLTDGAHVVQVTSAVPGEGKSTMAASIAMSAASVGKRTVLVDLDFYNPAVGKMFGGQGPEGVIEAILGGGANTFVTRAHETLPLYTMSAGLQSTPRPDVIESSGLRTLIADLAQNYDLVVLDSPPVLAISDPLRIAGLCSATIMVVAWCDTQRDMVQQAVQALREARAPLAGVVLNKVDLRKTGMYGGKSYTYQHYSSG
jgi:capsular exopolysaccharide synthesis family protein